MAARYQRGGAGLMHTLRRGQEVQRIIRDGGNDIVNT